MERSIRTGVFTCEVNFRIVRAPKFVREERSGVTYLVGRDYELAYETTLRFEDDAELLVHVVLVGELNQQVVIRDTRGIPQSVSGYTQGRLVVNDSGGNAIFRGRYYDSRIVQSLSGDDSLTATGQRVVDHWENGFGEGPYAGHAFSLGVRLTRERRCAATRGGSGPYRLSALLRTERLTSACSGRRGGAADAER